MSFKIMKQLQRIRCIPVTILFGFFLVSCGTESSIKQNTATAIDLVAKILLYEKMQYKGGLPNTLDDLVSVGLLKEVPQCKCADGKLRGFIYISGYNQTVPPYVVLASPPEMDSKDTVVVYMDLTAKVMPHEEAAKEIEKSRTFAKSIRGIRNAP